MDKKQSKRILITGGSGFLGSNLCERMLNMGNEVICLDNFITSSKRNIMPFFQNSFFEFINHDVCFPINVEVDEIYNLACPASPIHYQSDPIKTMKTNVLGAINLLELAKKLKCNIFQASTSEVYGDPLFSPQKEDYLGNVSCTGIRSCYDEGKRSAETLFFDYWRSYSIPIKVGRIFNTYGPRMHPQDGRVVSNFIVQALLNKPITIYGDGLQTRSFCYVDDLIDGIISFMDSSEDFTGPVNLGNPYEFSVIELAEKVIKLTNSSSKFVFQPLPEDDPKQRKPDIKLANNELKWDPKISLEEGLKHTIKFFDQLLSEDPIDEDLLASKKE
jgi:UDP-glucuronate decarboxylase